MIHQDGDDVEVGAATIDDLPVAVVGLGKMGLPMSLNLARAGWNVRAVSRSPRAVVEAPPSWQFSLDVAAALDGVAVVITVLPDLPQVREVLDGILTRGQVVVVMGTVSPVAVRAWAEELSASGVHLVDAPVSGGTVGADEAALSIMAGGDDTDLARVLPILETMGTVRHLGPVGSGELAKACNQVVVAATLTALGEAVTLGERGGLDAGALLDVMACGLAGSRALEVKRTLLESGDFSPQGSAAFQHKDLGFALEAARDGGTALPLTALVDQLYGAMRWTGHGDDDHSGIVQMTRLLSGP